MIFTRPRFLATSLFMVACASGTAFSQSTPKLDCGSVAKLNKPKNGRIISLGVINGKAIDLVKPNFPEAARAVDAHGAVEISVLIDPRGCVIEATYLSGHPLLVSASLKAALKSTFSPTAVSGTAIWINGVITYNYLPDRLNYLELGLISHSVEKLTEYLPSELESRRDDLKKIGSLPYDERQKAISDSLDMIHVDLVGSLREQWLFDVGRTLNDISKFNWIGPDGLAVEIKKLNGLVNVAPSDVSKQLVPMLRTIIDSGGSSSMWQHLKNFETLAPNLGK